MAAGAGIDTPRVVGVEAIDAARVPGVEHHAASEQDYCYCVAAAVRHR